MRSRNSLIRSDLHSFAIFRVKIGVKGRNLNFYEVKFGPKFQPLTPFFTLKMTKPCNSDLISEFLDLKSYSGENFSPFGEKKFSSVVTKSVNFRKILLLRKALLRKAATFCYKKRIFEVDIFRVGFLVKIVWFIVNTKISLI